MKCNINNCEMCTLETCELYEPKWVRKEKSSMETEKMIRELRRLEEKHKNDRVGTCENNWSAMCNDVANRLEEQEKEIKVLKQNMDFEKLLKAMQESYPKSKAEYVEFDVYVRDVMKQFTLAESK